MKIVLSFILFFAVKLATAAPMQYTWNTTVEQAYQKVASLRVQEAGVLNLQEIKAHPTNAYPILFANYIDFYELFFNENATIYAVYKSKVKKRLALLENADANVPMYLHSLAMIDLQSALIAIKFDEKLSAAKYVRSAYKKFEENKKKFPAFIEGDGALGTIELAVGTLPSSYKWIASVFGFSGNKIAGQKYLENSIANKKGLFMDRLFFYVYAQQYLMNDKPQAWRVLQPYTKEAENNRLLTFMLGNISINQNKGKEAEKIFAANIDKPGFLNMPILNYELGNALLCRWSPECVGHFLKYTQQYKGSFYVRDAYYKLALYYLANNNSEMHTKYLQALLSAKKSESDADKSATLYAKAPYPQFVPLIKARFLNDGGYHSEALSLLDKVQVPAAFQLENYYRRAKLFQDSGNSDSAIIYYKKTIDLGVNDKRYFSAKSALSLGILYEQKGDKVNAKKWFQQCIDSADHESEASLEQRAKAGLQRVK